jgi:hypothetical protein
MFPFGLVERLEDETLGGTEEGGVVVPNEELRVEEDFAVGMVPLLDSEEDSLEEPCVLKLALDRRRRSLKKGIVADF